MRHLRRRAPMRPCAGEIEGSAGSCGQRYHIEMLEARVLLAAATQPVADALAAGAAVAMSAATTADTTPPRVIASSIQEGDRIAPGNLSYSVTFNEPMLVANLDASDFSLKGTLRGSPYPPISFSYNPAGTVLTLTYANLPEDNYTLTLLSATGRFADAAGNILDGEPTWPLPAIGSGDGIAGGNFFVDFAMDVDQSQFPVLAAKPPAGGLAFDGTASGFVNSASDTDSFLISVDPGQQLSIVASSSGNPQTLRPQVDLLSKSGTLLGTATAATVGQRAVIQGVALPSTDDTFIVRVSGAGGTIGSFSVKATLNGALESEEFGGATDDTRATAQSLDPAFTPLGNGASRALVVGTLGSGFDWYSFTLAAGDSASVAIARTGAQTGEKIALYDSAGNLLAGGVSGPGNVDSAIGDFVAPSAGVYYVQVSGGSNVGYDLLVTHNATYDLENNGTPATAQPVQGAASPSGVQTVLGHIDAGDVDLYRITLAAGASLVLATQTPGGGLGEPTNTLNPRLRLLDSTGAQVAADDNSNADGRNAAINFTSAGGGTYYVEVSSTTTVATSGDYVLNVTGASVGSAAAAPFSVTASTPASGALLKTVPTTATITFSDAILVSSLNPSDLRVDGIPATAVTVGPDGNTAIFTLPALADGAHALAIDAGSISDVQGTPVQALASSFSIDTSGPKVIASSIQDGATLNSGSVTYTVTFSDPMRVGNLDFNDLPLWGLFKNTPYVPTSLGYDPTGTVLTVTYQNLPEDQYQLTLLSGNGQFEDSFGNDLDGEAHWPIPPNRSGNGVAGGNFVANFAIDLTGGQAFSTPQFMPPIGSLIYDSQASGAITSAGDSDAFTLAVHAGQTITVVTRPIGSGLRPIVTLGDPNGIGIGTATASAAGGEAVLQSVLAATTGTYTVNVGGAGNTVGAYSVELILNAAVELEGAAGGGSNDTPAQAQNIDGSFVSLGGSASRGAVIGSTEYGALLNGETEPNDTNATASNGSYSFVSPPPIAYELALTGSISGGVGDVDFYNIGRLRGGMLSMALAGAASSSQATLGPGATLELWRTGSPTPVVSVPPASASGDPSLYRFTINADDTYYLKVIPAAGTSGTYQLGVFLESAGFLPPSTGFGSGSEKEPNDTLATATDVSLAWYGLGGRAETAGSFASGGGDTDVYSYDLLAGDIVTFSIRAATARPKMKLMDGSGAVLAVEDGSSFTGSGTDSWIYSFTVPATGTYYLQTSALSGDGNYTLDVYSRLGATYGSFAPDTYSMTLMAGQATSVTLTPMTADGSYSFTILDPSGTTVATGTALGRAAAIADFIPSASGTYYVRVSGTAGWLYDLVVARGAGLDAEPNDSRATAQDLSPSGTMLGYQNGSFDDWYRFTAASGDAVNVSTATPGGPPGEFVNTVDPVIEVYDPNGVLVSSAHANASDGRNATIQFTAPASGYYFVRLTSLNNTSGEYVLSVTGNAHLPVPSTPDLMAFSDTGVSPTDNLTNLNNSAADRTLQFSVGGTVAGTTVTIYANGVAIGSAAATGTTTIVTTTPGRQLDDGTYNITARLTLPGAGGSEGPDSKALAITIDTVAPFAPAAPVLGVDTGISNTDHVTSIASFNVSAAPAPYYRLYRNGVRLSANYEVSALFLDPSQIDGTFDYTITAVDAAGNESLPSAPTNVTVDTTPPAAPSAAADLQAGSDRGVSSADDLTNAASLVFDVPATQPYYDFYRVEGDNRILLAGYASAATVTAAAPATDGKYAYVIYAVDAAGNESAPSPALFVTTDRHPYDPANLNATLDTTFGVGGVANTGVITLPSHLAEWALMPDGRIVLAGGIPNPGTVQDFQVGRFNADGSIDSTFAGGTVVKTNVVSDDVADAVVVQADGKIILAGQTSSATAPFGISWVRYNADGTLDPTFGVGGMAINPVPGTRFLHNAMLLLPDGKILTALAGFNGTALSFEVARLNSDGTLDTTFGSGGTVFTNFGGNGDTPYAIARQADGKIVVAGFHSDAATGQHFLALARYTSEGSLDAGFGTGGTVKTIVNGTDDLYDMILQSDGRIVAAGRTVLPGESFSRKLVVRYLPDGALDPNFGNNGIVIGGSAGSVNDAASSLALQADGAIIVGGYTGASTFGNGSLTRFTPAGVLDPTFGNGGIANLPSLGPISRVTVLSPDKILAAGGNGIRLYRINMFDPNSFLLKLRPASDTGASNSDGITSVNTPTFDVHHPDPYFRVYRNGVLISGPYETGSTYAITSPLADGTYDFTMTTVDAAGNESPAAPVQHVVVDTTVPAVQIGPVAGGPAPMDGVTISFSEPVFGLDLSKLALTFNGGAVNLLTAGQTLTASADHRTWTLGNLAGLAGLVGQYHLALATAPDLVDAAGNPLAPGASADWSMNGLVAGAAGGTIYLRMDDDGSSLDVWQNGARPGQDPATQRISHAQLTQLPGGLVVSGGAGDDTLVLDLSHGNPLAGVNLVFAGGGGSDSLAFVGTAGSDTVTAGAAGDVTFASSTPGIAPVALSTSGVEALSLPGGSGGDDAINLTGGTYAVNGDTPAGPPDVSIIVGSGAAATFGASEHLAGLTINGTGAAAITGGTGTTLSVDALSITGSGLLDLGKGALSVDNVLTPEAALRQYLAAAYNADPSSGIGNWLGKGGITSSDAIASHNGASPDFHRSVGYVNGAYASDPLIGGSIPGQPSLPADRILIRSALYGDLNLDGKVDDTDLSIFSGLGQYSKATDKFGWLGGDLNYDDKVDDTDLQIFSGAGNFNAPPPPPSPAPSAAAAAAAVAPAAPATVAPSRRSAEVVVLRSNKPAKQRATRWTPFAVTAAPIAAPVVSPASSGAIASAGAPDWLRKRDALLK